MTLITKNFLPWPSAAAVLRRWLAEDKVTVEGLAVDTNVSDMTIRNYAKCVYEPSISWIYDVARSQPELAKEMLAEILSGSDLTVGNAREFDLRTLDANGDGRPDSKDSKFHINSAISVLADVQKFLMLRCERGSSLGQDDIAETNSKLAEVGELLEASKQCCRASAVRVAR